MVGIGGRVRNGGGDALNHVRAACDPECTGVHFRRRPFVGRCAACGMCYTTCCCDLACVAAGDCCEGAEDACAGSAHFKPSSPPPPSPLPPKPLATCPEEPPFPGESCYVPPTELCEYPGVRVDAGTSNALFDCPARRGEGCVFDVAAMCDMTTIQSIFYEGGGIWMVMVGEVKGATMSSSRFSPPPPPQFEANLDVLYTVATAELPMIVGPPTEHWCAGLWICGTLESPSPLAPHPSPLAQGRH